MGLLADLVSGKGDDSWRQAFATYKEEARSPINDRRATTSLSGGESAFIRLLQAFRSNAPGGWSDNRWEQTVRHFVGIQYMAIHRKCEQLAQSEYKIYQRDENHPDGRRPVRKDHEGYKLNKLMEDPNPDDSFSDMMYKWGVQLDLTGKAMTWMVPNALGSVMEIYPIPTALAIPQTVFNDTYPHGYYRIQPIYPYGAFTSMAEGVSAVGATIPAQWMMEVKFPHPFLRYEGYSPLTALRLHIDEVEAMDRSRFYSMKRSINPSAVLNMDGMEGGEPLPESEIERIKAEFLAAHQGPENHGNLFVASPGARLDWFGALPKDMDYQSGWNQLVSFVLAGFGITKPAAGIIEDSSYSTLFATLKQLHLLTLGPICKRIGDKLTKKLASIFGDDLIIEIKCPRIDDHDLLNSRLSLLMAAKAISKNEMRKYADFPITKDEWGRDMAGTDSNPEGGMGGLGALLAGAMQGQGPTGAPGEEQTDETRVNPNEVERGRPVPGREGAGSRGPMKSFNRGSNGKILRPLTLANGRSCKSFYDMAREVIGNGN